MIHGYNVTVVSTPCGRGTVVSIVSCHAHTVALKPVHWKNNYRHYSRYCAVAFCYVHECELSYMYPGMMLNCIHTELHRENENWRITMSGEISSVWIKPACELQLMEIGGLLSETRAIYVKSQSTLFSLQCWMSQWKSRKTRYCYRLLYKLLNTWVDRQTALIKVVWADVLVYCILRCCIGCQWPCTQTGSLELSTWLSCELLYIYIYIYIWKCSPPARARVSVFARARVCVFRWVIAVVLSVIQYLCELNIVTLKCDGSLNGRPSQFMRGRDCLPYVVLCLEYVLFSSCKHG